jgi:hypothetical protein
MCASGAREDRPMRYDIRVAGHCDAATAEAFPEAEIVLAEGSTVLSADLDQAALHGMLERIRVRRIELLEVRRTRPQPEFTVSE